MYHIISDYWPQVWHSQNENSLFTHSSHVAVTSAKGKRKKKIQNSHEAK